MTGKQVIKKALAITMIFTMIFSIMAVPAAAKSRPKLSKTKVTIKTGKSVTLKVSGTSEKAEWYVKGKKLVNIKTNGAKKHKAVIKAKKKAGICYVKVKVGKKTLTCRVKVTKSNKDTPKPEFKEKPLSGTSKDRTAEFAARSVDGKETDAEFKKAMTGASLELLKYLAANEEDKSRNILISPDSILTAMAMVENGASGNTLSQMETAFGGAAIDDFDAYLYTLNKRITSSKSVKYHLSDSIWYKEGELDPKEDFLRKNVDYFGSQIYEAPFSPDTVSDINNWVYNKTRGMIPEIIKKLDTETVMLLINAIAFEGRWAQEYYSTLKEPFTTDDGAAVSANMLKGIEDTFLTINGAKGFVKPYEGGEIAFLGLETPKGMTVDQFVESLTAEDFVKGYEQKVDKHGIVRTTMPEFKYDYDASLVKALMSMGITDAFDSGLADFSDIATLKPDESLSISDVIHKTHIELDKEGTKAAAVTAVIVDKASAMPTEPKEEVNLNHPFVYAIIDVESGIPLFIGTVKTLK